MRKNKVIKFICLLVLTVGISYANAFDLSSTDKELHMTVSSLITVGTYTYMREHNHSRFLSTLSGVLLAGAAGASKEYLLDTKPDEQDLIADGIGIAGSVGFLYFTWKF